MQSDHDVISIEDGQDIDRMELSKIEALQAKYISSLEARLKDSEEILLPSQSSKQNSSNGSTKYTVKASIKRYSYERFRQVKPHTQIFVDADLGTLIVGWHLDTQVDAVEESASSELRGKAHRLAINSQYLCKVIFEQIDGTSTASSKTNVLVYPFKPLVQHEKRFRQAYEEAEKIYQDALKEQKQNGSAEALNQSNDNASKSAAGQTSGNAVVSTEALLRNRDELACLVEFMDVDMADIFKVQRDLANKSLEMISFEHLWAVFKPGDVVVKRQTRGETQEPQAYLVLHVTGGRFSFDPGHYRVPNPGREMEGPERGDDYSFSFDFASRTTPLLLDCIFIDSNGEKLGPVAQNFVFSAYVGERPIHSLEVYPAQLDNDPNLMSQLLERGRRYVSLKDGSHKRYTGTSAREGGFNTHERSYVYYAWRGLGRIRAEEINSEVIIDQAAGLRHFRDVAGAQLRLGGKLLHTPSEEDKAEIHDSSMIKTTRYMDVVDDSIIDRDRRNQFMTTTNDLEYHSLSSSDITEMQLCLLPNRVLGYVMRNRKWLALKIGLISDIVDTSPEQMTFRTRYEDLVLPKGHKELLQALISYYTRADGDETRQDTSIPAMDIVHGKGEGLIILLHGPPGVGKTSTAECVAAQLKRPLLPITCGDLGNNTKELESQLDQFCALAYKWRCVLLLDEADIYLSKREKGDIDRNARVGIFLRVLEYYSGVLILTSNRVGEIDEAFRSRIHICLFYPKLDKKVVSKVWEKNIQRVKSSEMNIDVEDEEIRRFYRQLWKENQHKPSRHWNGRQIKNSFQTAIALAHWEFDHHKSSAGRAPLRPVLRADHFKRVGQTSAHFDDYIGSIHGTEEQDTYSVLAAREEVRRDSAPIHALIDTNDARPLYQPRMARTVVRRITDEFDNGLSRFRNGDVDSDDDDDSDDRIEDDSDDNQVKQNGNDEDASEDDDIETLKLKLKIAELEKKKKSGKK